MNRLKRCYVFSACVACLGGFAALINLSILVGLIFLGQEWPIGLLLSLLALIVSTAANVNNARVARRLMLNHQNSQNIHITKVGGSIHIREEEGYTSIRVGNIRIEDKGKE